MINLCKCMYIYREREQDIRTINRQLTCVYIYIYTHTPSYVWLNVGPARAAVPRLSCGLRQGRLAEVLVVLSLLLLIIVVVVVLLLSLVVVLLSLSVVVVVV